MTPLLDPRDLRLLDGARLRPRRSFTGRTQGERLTKRTGLSIEFSDYREYVEGDDLRHLDWNVLARLDSAVVKAYRDEEDLAVHLLVDASPSMEFGTPSKLQAAKRFAAAFGTVALGGGDSVYPRTLGAGMVGAPNRYRRVGIKGRAGIPRLYRHLDGITAVGGTRLSVALTEFTKLETRLGVVALFTDGLDEGLASALRTLGGRGHEVLVVQILADEELAPDLEGDLRLIDAEGGAPVEITANSRVIKGYLDRLGAHNQALEAACLRAGGRYALVRASASLDVVVHSVWRRQGWIE